MAGNHLAAKLKRQNLPRTASVFPYRYVTLFYLFLMLIPIPKTCGACLSIYEYYYHEYRNT